MGNNKKNLKKALKPIGSDFFEHSWKESWTYIKTVVDIVREPLLILSKDFKVVAANEPFYQTFRVEPEETENEIIYDLGNGQWDIPVLRKLLENILPKNTFFKGLEVSHEFPSIGRKVMILNARQIHFKEDVVSESTSGIILLAMEDITEMVLVAETITNHSNLLRAKLKEKSQDLEGQIKKLKKENKLLKQNKKDKNIP